jgi:uroporphyrinogen decarboxylase
MNSRERVLAAVERRRPDRVPADYKADPQVDARLCARLGAGGLDALQDRLDTDIRRIEPRRVGPPDRDLGGGVTEDYWGIRSRPVRTASGIDTCFLPTALHEARTMADLRRHPWPWPDIFDYSALEEGCRRHPDRAILFEGSDLFTRPCILRGMENLMLDMVERPEMAHFVLEKFTAFYCEELTRALEATRGGFQLYCEWSDYGTQQGLLLSIPMWREFAAPYLRRLIDICHGGGVKFMLHSCGSVRKLIPDFIAIGIDVLDPIQVGAAGMNPAELKREFGDRLSFHGGIDIQKTLPFGSPGDVRREVAERVRTVAAGGGYIIAPTHEIQPDAPTENVLALYEPGLRESAA